MKCTSVSRRKSSVLIHCKLKNILKITVRAVTMMMLFRVDAALCPEAEAANKESVIQTDTLCSWSTYGLSDINLCDMHA